MTDRLRIRGITAVAALALNCAPAFATDYVYTWGHPRPQGNGIYGFAFLDASHGWAAGGGGTVLETTDAGVTWTLRHGPDDTSGDFNDVLVRPDGSLLVAGNGIRRSTDGGATWSVVPSAAPSDTRDLAEIPGGGIAAAGAGGAVLLSTDDGLTWTETGPHVGIIRHQAWRSAAEGYVVGQQVSHRTTNGGATWTQMTTPGFPGFNEIYFEDATHGTIVEDFGTWKSTDAGATWTQFFAPTPPLYRFRTVVLSPTHFIAAVFIEGGELWETTDAGNTWTERQNRAVAGFPAVCITPGGRLLWGSDTGDLFRSDDLGITCENATVNLAEESLGAPILRLLRRPDGVLFAANQPSMVQETQVWLRSDDGGESWYAPPATPALRWIYAGAFADADHGFVGQGTAVRTTTDGGDSWQSVTLTGRSIWAGAAPAVGRYFLCTSLGSGGDLLLSTDSGATWAPAPGGPAAGTFRTGTVHFADGTVGFAGGTIGSVPRVLRTTDGGDTWQTRASAGLPATPQDLFAFDAGTLCAAVYQSSGAGMYRSTDGGDTWTLKRAGAIEDVEFRDAWNGVGIVHLSANVAVTEDGGVTWTDRPGPFHAPGPGVQIAPVTAVAMRADGWVLGGAGNRIIVARDAAATDAPVLPATAAPASRSIDAFPNPFHPLTHLAFDTPQAGTLQVTVYDPAGRRVRGLYSGFRPAGRQSVAWDGRNDDGAAVAAGIYLVHVAAPGGPFTGKLVLRK